MSSATLAGQLIEVLLEARVERIYGVVGDSLNPVVDAVRRADGIGWVHVRNEEAGAFAAAAEAQLTGRLAVCAGSAGPGNTHLIQGLYDAHRSGAPVLAVASHIPSAQVGTGYFQETHPERLFVECSGYCELVSQAAQMPHVARAAVQHALGQGGVSVLVISGDVLHRSPVTATGKSDVLMSKATVTPAAEQVQALAEQLNAAGTVTLFCGAGVRGAHAEVMELAGKLASPVGHSLRGKEWIQYDNPYDVGMSGLLGYGAGNGSFDYAAIDRAAGIHSVRIEQPGDVRAGLSEALAHPGPALVDLVTDPNVLSIPPHITAAQVKGFALAAGKIVLDGGVGEMLQMARANLRNIPRPAIAR